MKTLTLQMASHYENENVVSEIWFGDCQVAEVSSEDGTMCKIAIFSEPDVGIWSFDLDAFQTILAKAKDNLCNVP